MLLDIYRRKLYSEGFDVYTAADGNAGLELIRTVHPQLVILDIVMPELEGYTVLKRIKRDAQMRNIPVIIFSNLSQEEEIEIAYQQYQFLFDENGGFIDYSRIKVRDRDGSLILTVNLSADLVGYRCEKTQKVLDFAKNDHDPGDFFVPICRPKNGKLHLRKGDFYIFFTKEYPRVPSAFAAEMTPVDVRAGEYRSHYAGYIDPGWGHGRDGSVKGQPLVLEMRPYEDNLVLEDGKPICKLIYERMTEEPDVVYGEGDLGSHYFSQFGPRLSRHFRK